MQPGVPCVGIGSAPKTYLMAPVARLGVPRLHIRRIVLDTYSGQAMAFGPAPLPGAWRLAQPGTAVIAAHRDTHFRFLKKVRVGDTIAALDLAGGIHRYRVTATQIVRWNRFRIVHEGSRQRLALAICYPFGASQPGPLRYVVHAVAVAAENRRHIGQLGRHKSPRAASEN